MTRREGRRCPYRGGVLTVSQASERATLTRECQLEEGHPGGHRREYVLYPEQPKFADEFVAQELVQQIIANQAELEQKYDRRTDQAAMVLAVSGGGDVICPRCPERECWKDGNCSCMARIDRGSNSPLLRLPVPARGKAKKLPGWWTYDRPIPGSPRPSGMRVLGMRAACRSKSGQCWVV